MEIVYIHAPGNMKHLQLRRSIVRYCWERGIRTRIKDRDAAVAEPIVIVDGYQMTCRCAPESDTDRTDMLLRGELGELIDSRAWLG